MRISIVDVFAEAKYAGNQLAVVEDAAHLNTAQMQDIAREMNFSETTFVTKRGEREADVRIFTPVSELPFAGHPTLGTAWVLSGGTGTFTLNLTAGAVPVRFDDGLGWISPPPVQLGGHMLAMEAAALLSLTEAVVDPSFPCQFAEVGPSFILIGLRDLASLKAATIDVAVYQDYLDRGYASKSVFVFTSQPYRAAANFAARMFFNAGGLREDPATGSANCAFAAYLLALKGALGVQVVDQGFEMHRPSTLYLRVDQDLAVGGRVVRSLRGELV